MTKSLPLKQSIDPLPSAEERKQKSVEWFKDLREQICTVFEKIEEEWRGTDFGQPHQPVGRFERKAWSRASDNHPDGGGGEMAILRGCVFEKVGVNISTVYGRFSEEFRAQIPGTDSTDGSFWASGISLVAHMRSPLVPAVHMNTRHIVTSHGWFGGGADLTPMFFDSPETAEDKILFHDALKTACDRHDAASYPRYKQWCDEYFYLKHRQEPRGVGGIFFDYLNQDWLRDFSFVQNVGRAFLDVYPTIVRKRMHDKWTHEQREHQLVRRGRYVEFNLLYDRGTMFGLKTNGHTDAILMSMPPEVKWP
jgi:coproporphyrinogen III oxidase